MHKHQTKNHVQQTDDAFVKFRKTELMEDFIG